MPARVDRSRHIGSSRAAGREVVAEHGSEGDHGSTEFAVRPEPREENPTCSGQRGSTMIILGVILLILGFVLGISILWTIGIILIVAGAVLSILGATGRAIGGRKTWY